MNRAAGALLAAAILAAAPGLARAQGGVPPAPSEAQEQDFVRFVETMRPAAEARGIARTTFDTAFTGVTLDPTVAALARRQPEFDKTLGAYLEGAVSARRVKQGADGLTRWGAELARIQSLYGVPPEIVVAVWGMETDFGADKGAKYVLRSLATLAFARPAESSFRDEILGALDILQKRAATRAGLLGSWAGAMGHPQFLPSAYAKYAVSYSGKSAPDIWQSIPDSLASIANFLKLSGWHRGLPWALEVAVPPGFDYGSLHQDFPAWRGAGFRAVSGSALPPAGKADLFLPEGAGGPAFLLSENYWVIKTYNVSDAYTMSVGLLADRIAGRSGIVAHWPQRPALDAKARAEVQTRLAEIGFYRGKMDGKLGPEARDAIHAFQLSVGMSPADGYASPALLARLAAGGSRQRQ